MQDSAGREIRIFDGEVESLTAAASAARAFVAGSVTAPATPTAPTSPRRGRGIAAGAVEAARIADPDEFTAAPEAAAGEVPEIEGLVDPASRTGLPSRSSSSHWRSSARPARRTIASSPSRPPSTRTAERVALASSTGLAGSEATSAYAYLQAIAEADGGAQTGSASGSAARRRRSTRRRSAREGGERAASIIGATKPSSRTCPVVLDPTVAASFVGLIGGALGADAVQRGRSPFAELLGEEVGQRALALHDDGLDPRASPRRPSTPRACPAADRADRGRAPCAPTCTTPTRRAAAAPTRPATPAAAATARRPRSPPPT